MAALAGVPEAVIKAAKKHLLKLEQESVDRNSQRDLFSAAATNAATVTAETPQEHPALALLRAIMPDELSPKDALEKIYALKKTMGE